MTYGDVLIERLRTWENQPRPILDEQGRYRELAQLSRKVPTTRMYDRSTFGNLVWSEFEDPAMIAHANNLNAAFPEEDSPIDLDGAVLFPLPPDDDLPDEPDLDLRASHAHAAHAHAQTHTELEPETKADEDSWKVVARKRKPKKKKNKSKF